MKLWSLVFLSLYALPSWAQGGTRAPISLSVEISSGSFFGGAIRGTLLIEPPDPFSPSVLNGEPISGEADLTLKLDYRYLAPGVLGSKNEGEFVPYQTVRVRIENLTTADPDNLAEFDLVPTLSIADGWHYASSVRLPPVASTEDVLAHQFRFTVVSISLASMGVHSDALPPSSLFRPATELDVVSIFDDVVDLSAGRSLARSLWGEPASALPESPKTAPRHSPCRRPPCAP